MENTAQNKVKIKLVKGSDGMLNYDVQILDQQASVQDYLDALNDFQEEKVAPCDGCSNCCWERVPLTAPDVLRYAAVLYGTEADGARDRGEASGNSNTKGGVGEAMDNDSMGGVGNVSLYSGSLRQKDTRQNLRFIREYAEIRGGAAADAADAADVAAEKAAMETAGAVTVEPAAKEKAAAAKGVGESPGVVDIYLRRLERGNCVFLDQDKQRCRTHALRPLVCQSYVCLPSSRRAEALRRQIVNEGENELIHILGEQVAGDWQAYQSKGFAGKERFADIAIRDVVNEGLWQRLLAAE